ncbi:MAG: glycosyltransferase, partial [Pseudomonadota bacterium]
LDALYQQVPVVASAVGGIPDIVVDGQTGLLVPPNDANSLEEALARLIDDAALQAHLTTAGTDRIGDYSAARMADRYVELYANILNSLE